MTASASAKLAHVMAQERDETILEAISLIISQRPTLQVALMDRLQEPPPARYVGTIKSFFASKQYGFIDCEELKQHYSGDVFMSEEEKGSFNIGDSVSFTTVLNKDGRPQARLLERVGPAVPPAPAQFWPQPAEKRAIHDVEVPPPPAPLKVPRISHHPHTLALSLRPLPVPSAGAASERLAGVIKSFWPEKRYGFIACPEASQAYGGDVFLSDQEVGDFTTGSMVTFSVTLNRGGKPQARQLEAWSGEEDAAEEDAAEMSVTEGEGAAEVHVGVIKSFFPEKHYGFVWCETLAATHGGDVFLSSLELGSFGVGSWVEFDTAYNKHNRPQARNLREAVF